MDKWICQICGQEFKNEADMLAHQFNSQCEKDLCKLEADASRQPAERGEGEA